ncbi:long-chain-fatty-acid--CoA ligase [Brevibacillus massiliensis]|jgi:long-chain acyl-CoA synthetase|uniref:long-chain-fatty-acid--CoA ligase n=1 Tax=Brevibacillus massiliensis TaxID=1118054 RepID=UPI00030D51A8|nr:long-chain-fatty-acid--CoA ligase [Brevibacillus massiliensis]
MSARLDQMIRRHAVQNPEQLALGTERGTWTYRKLDHLLDRLAQAFVGWGISPGDRIAIVLMNREEFVLTYFACMRAGAISVPVNPVLSARELQLILSDCAPRIVVSSHPFLEKLEQVEWKEAPLLLNADDPESFAAFIADGKDGPLQLPADVEESTIIYTSGTTGLPKGALLTHGNLYSNAQAFAEALEMSAQEKTLIVAPVFHTAAQTCCLNATVYSGGYNYLLERWESSQKTLQTMEQEKISFFFGPPTMYTYMLQDPQIKEYDLSLRLAFTGAAPLPVEVFAKWKELLGFEIVEGYGLSETSPVVTINPPFGRKKPGSIGTPIRDVQVRICYESEQDDADGVGELIVKGPNVMKEYWNKPEESAKALREGWLHTGDMARMDEDGYFYIVDRKKDMINRAGFKIYPRELEEVIYQHPSVLEVAVVGIPDPVRGEEVKAFITLKQDQPAPTLEELHSFCEGKLASYKFPRMLEVLDQMPKTVSGKILKTSLRGQ